MRRRKKKGRVGVWLERGTPAAGPGHRSTISGTKRFQRHPDFSDFIEADEKRLAAKYVQGSGRSPDTGTPP